MSRTTSPEFWIRWLRVVLWLLLGYSLVLVLAGSVADSMFTALGFGPPRPVDTREVRDYLRLPYMVLGAVLAGWAMLMIGLVGRLSTDAQRWLVPMLLRSVALWFVLDTGMSIVLGHPTHALFNVPFAIALALPLVKLAGDPVAG